MSTKTASPRDTSKPAWNSKTFSVGFVVKLLLMCVIDAFGIYVIYASYAVGSWWVLAAMVVLLIAVNYTYFTNRFTLPAKYLLPGVVFLLVFQVFAVLFNAAIAFTNAGDGHKMSSPEEAATYALIQDGKCVGTQTYPMGAVRRGSEVYLAIIKSDGSVWVGNDTHAMTRVSGAEATAAGQLISVPGYDIMSMAEIGNNLAGLRAPLEDQPGTFIQVAGIVACEAQSTLSYDSSSQTITDTTNGTQYHAQSSGDYAGYFLADGETRETMRFKSGWQVGVGFKNFTSAFFSGSEYGKYFLSVTLWTFAFSFLSVLLTFLLGTFLAIVLNDERVKGRKIYRTLLLLPYAFPSFLGALVWRNMLNADGFINDVLLGGIAIDWLQTQTESGYWLARGSLLLVQLWLGFPYMFLISTGALQSLPGDVKEAATVDGANPIKMWLNVTGPLLLISTAPVLVSSFAFNFNNFTLIYMLTKGGPSFGATEPIGATDILISMVYRISGAGGGTARADLGLAAALSIVIFIVVALVSVFGFRQTRKLEEMV